MAPRRAVTKGLISAVLQNGGLLKDLTVRHGDWDAANTYAQGGAYRERPLGLGNRSSVHSDC
jgi:hypothetical protein